jgi:hypothetical protein
MIKIVIRIGRLYFETYPEWTIVSVAFPTVTKRAILFGYRWKFHKVIVF